MALEDDIFGNSDTEKIEPSMEQVDTPVVEPELGIEPDKVATETPVNPPVEQSTIVTKEPVIRPIAEPIKPDNKPNLRDQILGLLQTKGYVDIQAIRSLLEGKEKLPKPNNDDYNLFYRAYYCVDNDADALELSKLFHEAGEDINHFRSQEGKETWSYRPVFEACKKGFIDTFEYITSIGADLKGFVIQNTNKKIPTRSNLEEYTLECKKNKDSIFSTASDEDYDRIIGLLGGKDSKKISPSTKITEVKNLESMKEISNMINEGIAIFQKVFDKINELESSKEDVDLSKEIEEVKTFDTKVPKTIKSVIFGACQYFLRKIIPKKTGIDDAESLEKYVDTLDKADKSIKTLKKESLSVSINEYTKLLLENDYKDTAYYKKNMDTAIEVLKQLMPGLSESKTVEQYIGEVLTDPSSIYIPANPERLESIEDFVGAVVYKIFMKFDRSEPKLFDTLFNDILAEYGKETRKGGIRKETGVIYSCAYCAADLYMQNVLTQDAQKMKEIQDLYNNLKKDQEEAFIDTEKNNG